MDWLKQAVISKSQQEKQKVCFNKVVQDGGPVWGSHANRLERLLAHLLGTLSATDGLLSGNSHNSNSGEDNNDNDNND